MYSLCTGITNSSGVASNRSHTISVSYTSVKRNKKKFIDLKCQIITLVKIVHSIMKIPNMDVMTDEIPVICSVHMKKMKEEGE